MCVCVGGREVKLQEDAACSVCCGLRGAVSRHCNRTLEGWVVHTLETLAVDGGLLSPTDCGHIV